MNNRDNIVLDKILKEINEILLLNLDFQTQAIYIFYKIPKSGRVIYLNSIAMSSYSTPAAKAFAIGTSIGFTESLIFNLPYSFPIFL